jgi:hypothetical protein
MASATFLGLCRPLWATKPTGHERIKFDPACVEQTLGAMHSGMMLMITDLAAGPETRSEKDFVIVTSEFVQS